MIPSVVASEVTGALRDFLATGFGPSSPEHASVVNDFLADPENLVKGPYLSVALPFRRASEGGEPFPEVPLGFTPYRHQRTAFSRLAASAGRSTVIATGTGSGKTECFLYPILDYCREQAAMPSGRKEGIKAILVYPMNALAMDQARRIAQTIHRTPSLRGRVSAGLYVGESERTPHTGMGPDHVITDRGTLRERPPDILLTNYKMLDFLLIRPIDHRLWRHNAPDTLRYLVVDELHTFDGAQHEVFFGQSVDGDIHSADWRVALAQRLREHLTFVNLLRVLEGRPKPLSEIVERLRPSLPVANDGEAAGLLNGLCALISVARRLEDDTLGPDAATGNDAGGTADAKKLRPFLQVGLHLWVCELRRMVCRFYATAGVAVMHGKHAKIVVPERGADLWRGVPSLDLGMQDEYRTAELEPPTWFGRLYRETVSRVCSSARRKPSPQLDSFAAGRDSARQSVRCGGAYVRIWLESVRLHGFRSSFECPRSR